MKTLLSFFLLATLAISAGHAQESPITGPPPCRFLFLVESSKGMARISYGTAATVAGLVASGVSGLMRPGDSFALWHFNEEPFPFDFPNQVWQPEQASRRATEARIYLQNLRFDKPVRADLALREMFLAMTAADPLTVLLISNGESPLVGTPFDVEINKVYLRRGEELRQARLPFVTTLRCVNRQIKTAAVTAGREEIVLAEPAPEAASAAAAANPSAVSPTKAPTPGVAASSLAPYGRPAISSATVPAPPKLDPARLFVARERIANVFATPFSAPSTNGALAIAPPALPALPELPARAESPVTLVKTAPPFTNAAAEVAAPIFPQTSRTVESPLTAPRSSAARTNGESAVLPPPQLPLLAAAESGGAIAPPRLIPPAPATTGATAATGSTAKATTLFPRKSAPSFALETAGARSAPGAAVPGNPPSAKVAAVANPAPALSPRNPGKPLVPERIPEPPQRNAAVTNVGGKTLATVPPLIRPETTTRPIHFLFAGLVLLAVAGWFIVLIFRGSRRQSRSSISRAMDE